MTFQSVWAAICLLTACLGLLPADADAAVAANPLGISLTLSITGGRAVFHRGEVIPLTAAFGASVPGRYDLNTDPGNRDLLWNSDTFHCDSPGATDPLRVYYDREFGMAYSGSGPRFEPLMAKPTAIGYTLNEWLRFDVPGHYRVSLTSGRVVDAAKRHDGLFFIGHSVTSNAVEFTVLPDDPAWDARTLQTALPLLNADGFDYRMQEARAAVRTVRFLGTPEAGRAMVARYGHPSDYLFPSSPAYYQTRLGLLGFPNLSLIVAEMQRRLADPHFPVFSFFLYDLAQAQFLAAYPQTVPSYVPNNPSRDKERQDLLRQRMKALTAFSEQNRLALAAAVPEKQGRAKALSVFTLLQSDYQHPHSAAQRDLARALVPVFDDLTSEEQNTLLDESGYWPDIRGPQMLPLLRRVYAAPPSSAVPGGGQYEEDVTRRSLALRHLIELSPAEGRALLLAEIKSPTPRVDLATLCSLPDRTLPSLNAVLAVNLERVLGNGGGDWRIAPRLIERYATAAILPRVKAAYGDKGGKWACDLQSSLLAYFLRTDPAYGAAQLKLALTRRRETGCYRSVLSDVAALHYGPAVERLAVLHLHDPDPQTAADAAKTLGAYGSPAAEAPLWARMREWHRQWAGKAAEIEPTDKNIAPEPGQLEYALSFALATSSGWLLNPGQLQNLQSLCVTSDAKRNMEALKQEWTSPVAISFGGEADEWNVVQYHSLPSLAALEAKLTQFPVGTRFHLAETNFPDPAAQDAALHRLQAVCQKHGMLLTAGAFSLR